MWPVSERFKQTVADSHVVATKAEVLQGGNVIFDLTTAGAVVDGSVSVSRSAIQRTARLTLQDLDGTLTPTELGDLLTPAGNEIRLWRGVVFPDATAAEQDAGTDRELVPLGVFRFTSVKGTFPQVAIDEMYDRAWIVSGAKLEGVYSIAAGTVYSNAIETLLKKAYPEVVVRFPDTDEVTPLMTFEPEADPWEICQQLAANIGMRLFFDQLGTATMAPEPDPVEDPAVWTFDNAEIGFLGNEPARRNLMLPGTSVDWDGTSYNAVIVSGENSSLTAPVRAVARDLDPKSPTKYGSAYNRRPLFIRDEKVITVAQAQARARKELEQQLGLFQQLTIPALVMPAFDVADVIEVLYRREASEVAEAFVLDSLEIPLRATSNMTLNTRARQVVTLE